MALSLSSATALCVVVAQGDAAIALCPAAVKRVEKVLQVLAYNLDVVCLSLLELSRLSAV